MHFVFRGHRYSGGLLFFRSHPSTPFIASQVCRSGHPASNHRIISARDHFRDPPSRIFFGSFAVALSLQTWRSETPSSRLNCFAEIAIDWGLLLACFWFLCSMITVPFKELHFFTPFSCEISLFVGGIIGCKARKEWSLAKSVAIYSIFTTVVSEEWYLRLSAETCSWEYFFKKAKRNFVLRRSYFKNCFCRWSGILRSKPELSCCTW